MVTSLSPFATCCGFRLLKAPSPHPLWSTREQKLRVGMKKAGTVNPADPQQPQFPVPTPVQHCAGVPEPVQFAGSPGVPGHGLTLLPHAMHAVCWQLAVFVFSVKVKVTPTPIGKDRGMPPTVSHGVCRQVPDVPPQFASEIEVIV